MLDTLDRGYLWLHYGCQLRYRLFDTIREEYYYLEEAMEDVSKGQLSRFPKKVPKDLFSRLKDAAAPGFMERYEGWMERRGVQVLTKDSFAYPDPLKQVPDAPPVLFYQGISPTEGELCLALVGSRKCTEYGKDVSRLFGRELNKAGATVVTGLATGIDAYGALGALEQGNGPLPVIGVLGCGIDVVYPKGNEKLYGAVRERGCLLTEFLPKTAPMAHHFPIRNRIISGLSQGVIVVEAGERSGSAITARLALEQGRDVFAIPGRIIDPMSAGTNALISRGEAKLVTTAREVLEEYGLTESPEEVRTLQVDALPPIQAKLCRLLLEGDKDEDSLLEGLQLPMGELFSTLTELEISGIIKQLPGGVYALNPLQVQLVF